MPLHGENKLPVENLRDAQNAYRLILTNKEAGEMPQARRTPLFADYHLHYTDWAEKMGKKLKITVDKERRNLRRWQETLGTLPINRITKADINRHLMKRKEEGCCNRTLNLDVIVLGNCLKFARDVEGLIKHVATEEIKPLDHKAPTRTLVTEADIEKICAEATKLNEQGMPVYHNGQQLSDYVHFMLFSGARRESAAHVKWADVDFENRRVMLVKTKYSKVNMVVTFNDRLEKLLREMKARMLDSPWLFPNPWRLTSQANFRKTFDRVREKTNLETFNYHDCRHFFISWAVMSGVDTMTISKWVGHEDGGVLIGKVYGHLNDAHLQAQAKRLSFGTFTAQEPAPAPAPEPAPANMVDLSKMSAADLLAALVNLQKKDAVAA